MTDLFEPIQKAQIATIFYYMRIEFYKNVAIRGLNEKEVSTLILNSLDFLNFPQRYKGYARLRITRVLLRLNYLIPEKIINAEERWNLIKQFLDSEARKRDLSHEDLIL